MHQFGPFRFDSKECLLYRGDQLVALPPKALETLRCLLEHPGRLVEKEELIKAVWPDSFVEEGALTQNIFRLRRALGEHGTIETIPRRGYRFTSPIDLVTEPRLSPPVTRPSRRTVIAAGIGAAALAGAGAVLTWRPSGFRGLPGNGGLPEFLRLTRSGRVIQCALSPNETYVAYVLKEADGSSLWVVELEGGSSWRALGPTTGRWGGLTFSPDGSRIYVVLENTLETLLPSGAERRKLQQDIDEAPAFSPTAGRMAFVREDLEHGESAIILSSPDGSSARRIANRKLPAFYQALAWRPDGKALIASLGKLADAREMALVELDIDSGRERFLGAQRWETVTGIGWQPGARSLFVAAIERRWRPGQLWRLEYSSGKASRLTRDAISYSGVSVSRAGALATTGGSSVSSLAILRIGAATPAPNLADSGDSEESPVWLTRGRIVCESRREEQPQIWTMDENGGSRKQLTRRACASVSPAVAMSGMLIVFVSERASGSELWSMDPNGADLRPICSAIGIEAPACTPDGSTIFFTSVRQGKPVLWKVNRERGQPVQVTDRLSRMPAISPDGRLVAFYYWSEREDEPRRIMIAPTRGGDPSRVAHLEDGDVLKGLRWSPDGRALYCLLRRDGATEVWRRPLDGTAPAPITAFQDDRAMSFDISPDGERIVYSRLERWSDVLLLRPESGTGRA